MRNSLLTLILLSYGTVSAAERAPLPTASDLSAISIFPKTLTIQGADDAPQLIVTGELKNGKVVDLTREAKFSALDSQVVNVLPSGRVMPQANGSARIVASFAGKSAEVSVKVCELEATPTVNFTNQVVPIFTKLGCNAGGCHGKASGQNGFKLSLLGFEPDFDYNVLVKEARGRRLMPAAPDSSLLLLKATGQVPHGGGKKFDKTSEEYKIIRLWIALGMPMGQETDPVVTKITLFPEHRVLPKQSRQQLTVYAHYSDGKVEDITRRAQYETNEVEIAAVEPDGLVSTLSGTGQAAIMTRYQGHVAVFRATVPLGVEIPKYAFDPRNFIDKLVLKQWEELGMVPSELASDEQFLRRVYLDITGTLPTPAELKAFLSDSNPAKREKIVDALLERPEYAYFFANKWADVLRVKRGNQAARAYGTFSFHNWIFEAVSTDKPYDEFVREILGASGDEGRNPPTVWYKDINNPEQFVDNASQVFLGLRMACANCHHHPYEKWSQDDYWGLAAFYSRVGKKSVPVPGAQQQGQQGQRQLVYVMNNGNVVNKRTGKPAIMRSLEGDEFTASTGHDPRHDLADWMVNPKNPFFARAVANRYWAHFLGRGIVDPMDDMRVTNPPSNPQLLDALADELVKNKFSLKSLIRTICTSRTYQLSSTPNEFNKHDKQAYARFYPKRMSAEVLYDAVNQITDSPGTFNGIPKDRNAPNRAIMLPDESYQSYFLDVFGRPQRLTACECERAGEANLAQSLHLLNSDEVQAKLNRGSGRADALAKDSRPDSEKVDELFIWAIGHKPNERQKQLAMANIAKYSKTKREAYENILWALVNSKAFQFNY
jgi:hypothetical protein